ncbi:hypothetical protein RA20_20870 [Leisingera sp. ANG-Vp]|nr:hypothetical protein RA20_20870 [Leisingera sp. ANG-Vp]
MTPFRSSSAAVSQMTQGLLVEDRTLSKGPLISEVLANMLNDAVGEDHAQKWTGAPSSGFLGGHVRAVKRQVAMQCNVHRGGHYIGLAMFAEIN